MHCFENVIDKISPLPTPSLELSFYNDSKAALYSYLCNRIFNDVNTSVHEPNGPSYHDLFIEQCN